RSGMGLMIFPGDQVDIASYNERLYRKGAGLLPAQFEGFVESTVSGLVVDSLDASPLDSVRRLAPSALSRIAARKFAQLGVNASQRDVRVLAHWNDAESHPAIVEKQFGRGHVVLFTTTADKQWGDWPIDPTYVLATRSTAAAIAGGEGGESNVTAGQPLRFRLDDGAAVIDPKVRVPGSDSPEPAMQESPEPNARVIRFDHDTHAGAYMMSWKTATGQERS